MVGQTVYTPQIADRTAMRPLIEPIELLTLTTVLGTSVGRSHAAPLHSCKYRRLHAPATNIICTRSSSSKDGLCSPLIIR
jgi:hypothetical protein